MKKAQPLARIPRSRSLTDDEIELWIAVARSVTPRHGQALPRLLKEPALPEAVVDSAGQTPQLLAQPSAPKLPAIPPLSGMERRLKAKLAQGKAAVDAVLDLHGLHQHAAFAALRRFLSNAQRDGAKLVLVITGKGERYTADAFEPGGVLRRAVPHWLSAPELRPVVIGFEEATRPHGGSGALYVRIRRRDRVRRD
jgi:DNA-nicking Smr family endonuclease